MIPVIRLKRKSNLGNAVSDSSTGGISMRLAESNVPRIVRRTIHNYFTHKPVFYAIIALGELELWRVKSENI